MSYLSDLYAQKEELNRQLTTAQEKLKVQKERKKKVKRIKQDLNLLTGESYYRVNSMLDNAAFYLGMGIESGTTFIDTGNALREKYEKDIPQDSQLSSAEDNLQWEISAISSTIEDLQTEISQTRSSIWQTNQNISNEEWRIYCEEQEAKAEKSKS